MSENSEETKIYEAIPETAEQKAIRDWWIEQEVKSADLTDSVAKQIITLCTTLLGALTAILALTESTLPSYLSFFPIRLISAMSVFCLIVSLGIAVLVLTPKEYSARSAYPDEMRQSFQKIVQNKSRKLTWSLRLFGLGLFLLGLILIVAIFLA